MTAEQLAFLRHMYRWSLHAGWHLYQPAIEDRAMIDPLIARGYLSCEPTSISRAFPHLYDLRITAAGIRVVCEGAVQLRMFE